MARWFKWRSGAAWTGHWRLVRGSADSTAIVTGRPLRSTRSGNIQGQFDERGATGRSPRRCFHRNGHGASHEVPKPGPRLADDHGANVFFLLRSHAARLTGLIEGEGHSVRLLPDPEPPSGRAAADGTAYALWLPTTWQKDAEQTLEAIDRIGPVDWLIVDHYALDARWERMQRKRVPRILAIDDLADRDHDCDILLDQRSGSGNGQPLSRPLACDMQGTARTVLCVAAPGICRTAQIAERAQRRGRPDSRVLWRLRS